MSPAAQDPRWLDYLFRRHFRAELATWGRRLRYFRFCRALGGHANDGDHLLTALRYTDAADLCQLLGSLGLPVAADADSGVPASPGRVVLAGASVYVAVRSAAAWQLQQLEIRVADCVDPYEVTAQAVAAAEAVEQLLAAHAARIVDPPVADYHCVCPLHYPEIWAPE